MECFIVLYRDTFNKYPSNPKYFQCEVETEEQARKQCQEKNPGARIVYVHQGDNSDNAIDAYWN